ncbi:MAG: sulfotransferase family protein [Hyphomicrobiaceae bacterium]
MTDFEAPLLPFIVCYPRSGSTLLRLLLDAHPDLAIPPETHLCQLFKEPYATRDANADVRANVLAAFVSAHRWHDLHLEETELAERIMRVPDGAPARDAIACLWELYANKAGKPRWGDKTPAHLGCVASIAAIFPRARFIHVVRDVRDVACSMQASWFGQHRSLTDIAGEWETRTRSFRQHALLLEGRTTTVRYEDLVRETERVVRSVCEFIELPFSAAQLSFFQRAAERISELSDLQMGEAVASAQSRRQIHQLTSSPPTSERIGLWRTKLTKSQVREIEVVTAGSLAHYGYEVTVAA